MHPFFFFFIFTAQKNKSRKFIPALFVTSLEVVAWRRAFDPANHVVLALLSNIPTLWLAMDGNGGDINRMAPNFCKQVASSCSNFPVRLGGSHRFSDGFPVFFFVSNAFGQGTCGFGIFMQALQALPRPTPWCRRFTPNAQRVTLAEHPTAGMCVQWQSQGVVGRTEIGSSDSDFWDCQMHRTVRCRFFILMIFFLFLVSSPTFFFGGGDAFLNCEW